MIRKRSCRKVFPKPFPDEDEDYLLDVCIALNNTRIRHLNPVTYANVFFCGKNIVVEKNSVTT